MLEFVKSDDGDELYLYLDENGWERLQREVNEARRSGHTHLFSSDWGPGELTVTSGSKGSFHKVTITFERGSPRGSGEDL
jgi:hypothetical protein